MEIFTMIGPTIGISEIKVPIPINALVSQAIRSDTIAINFLSISRTSIILIAIKTIIQASLNFGCFFK